MSPAAEADAIWQAARNAADVVVKLPGRAGTKPIELFLQRVPRTTPHGFRMGSRGQSSDEEPIHRVVIERDFFLGTFSVTQAQWVAVWPEIDKLRRSSQHNTLGAPAGPSPRLQRDLSKVGRFPVESVTWFDAAAYCSCLSRHPKWIVKGIGLLDGSYHFCLPTEAEWEWACGAVRDTAYWSGDREEDLSNVGWYTANSDRRTHDVAEPVAADSPRHPLGLIGMHGNVWEWCHDVWNRNAYRKLSDGASDPSAADRLQSLEAIKADGTRLLASMFPSRGARVIRGGSCRGTASACRAAARDFRNPRIRSSIQGFRVCLICDRS